ncbi:RAD52 motif-containing protein 1-like isoform X2 [Liolophura sinensis]|uniref:RAD52 motif-containing protein 1-like isoform X2 n=1 Tax=Liolophura sinensis TaxID=3198878 RepID=UPI0031595204
MTNSIEIIDFFRPEGGRKNLFLSNISGSVSKDDVQVFPMYGRASNSVTGCSSLPATSGCRTAPHTADSLPLQSVMMPNPGLPTGWYAFVKFYSALAAGKAKVFLEGKLLFGQPYKISYAKRRNLQDAKPPILYVTKCQQLANHYLGFNGWSCCLKSMINDSDRDQVTPKVRYLCSVRIDITNHGLHSEGIGVSEAFMDPENPSSKGEVIGRVKKLTYQNALENAFSKIILIVLASGKVTVEVNTTMVDILLKKAQIDEAGLLKVNELIEAPASEENPLLEEDKPEMELDELTDSILDDVNMHILQDLENDSV